MSWYAHGMNITPAPLPSSDMASHESDQAQNHLMEQNDSHDTRQMANNPAQSNGLDSQILNGFGSQTQEYHRQAGSGPSRRKKRKLDDAGSQGTEEGKLPGIDEKLDSLAARMGRLEELCKAIAGSVSKLGEPGMQERRPQGGSVASTHAPTHPRPWLLNGGPTISSMRQRAQQPVATDMSPYVGLAANHSGRKDSMNYSQGLQHLDNNVSSSHPR
ncbi:hypothetical protein BDY17DRAFT_71117 [Neohortaea acidophila]|uniref:Uncharacterized protein n=1 Tax=Neohortaea acidophila TaxID=245834 RepID=A0A6A6Q2D6_9PEZI|nr:uncharacterized protein BDY17DRAFT_71117 [Neohortaea acidophila]KAF2486116.1 hypothetical protein BDY17DRAFT_71117 [Neohortaea acidophila]